MKAKTMLKKIEGMNNESVVCFDSDRPVKGIVCQADSLPSMACPKESTSIYLLDADVKSVNTKPFIKIEELKEALAAYSESTVRGTDGCEILCIREFGDFIELLTENEMDMPTEISAMWNQAITLGLDEDLVYGDMIERGITPAMVRKYDSPKQAAHMAEYCVEHGLMSESDLSDDDICVLGTYSDGRKFAIPKTDTSQLFREVFTSTGSTRGAKNLIKWLNNPEYKCGQCSCKIPFQDDTALTIELIPTWEVETRTKQEYTVRVTRYGYATITASSMEEAIKTTCGMNPEEFEWGGLNDAEIV